MEQQQMDILLSEGKYEELIYQLKDAEYDEYSMLTLCRAYLFIEEEGKAKKILRKLKVLFPTGEFWQEEKRLGEAIENNAVNMYLSEWKSSRDIATQKVDEDSVEICLTEVLNRKSKNKKERKIPRSIKECFNDVVGLEGVQVELDKFYKLLRFQNERREKDFDVDLLKSTHWVISGARGSGKTLVGEIIAELLYDFGIRAEKQAVYIDAREILAAYEQDNSKGIKSLFEQVNDVTIIIENAQEWIDEVQDTVSKAMLISLEKALKEERNNVSIILTGTSEVINKIIAVNETMIDAFYGIIEIPIYSTTELIKIARKIANEMALEIDIRAEKALIKKIDMEKNSSEFMNGITIKRFLDEATIRMAERYYENNLESESDMVYLMPDDFKMELEEENIEELLTQLDALTGLQAVKQQIRKRIETVQAEELARQVGAERKNVHGSLHMVFVGNPGTGKTTVARLVGKIYQQLGVLPYGNRLIECTRSDLVGQYVGQTAKLVQEKVKEAIGGVLFIDEAYALCRDAQDNFGREAVDELIVGIENNKDSMLVILAGYKKEMSDFLKTNPGFSSRIRNIVEFEDYTVEEMVQIFKFMVTSQNMKVERGAEDSLYQMIEVKSKIPDFGNARGIRNLFEEVIEVMNERILRVGLLAKKEDYDTVRKEDIETVVGKKLDSEKSLDELLQDLNNLTGLQAVKDKVQEMVDDILVKEYMKEHSLGDAVEHGTLHLVFKGNAGTGKTTVARTLGKIYKKMGILKKDVFVECGRKDLVANYSGQTATQVIKKVDEADGGILFIDEAYTLNGGERDEFGKEAINTLVAELENRRDRLMVIVAGYADEMDKFLNINQGLASRLSNEIIFEDYTIEELLSIFRHMANEKGMILPRELDNNVLELIDRRKSVQKDFGNARGIRNLVERVEKKKNARIAAFIRNGIEIDDDILRILRKEDLE